jgi:hypothetical protein
MRNQMFNNIITFFSRLCLNKKKQIAQMFFSLGTIVSERVLCCFGCFYDKKMWTDLDYTDLTTYKRK